jgi:histone deacetylase 11
MVPLVYSPNYNITAFGIEKLHPFDSVKYRRIHDWLIRQGLRRPGDFVTPQPCTQEDLLLVHTPEYLDKLRYRIELARMLEVWIVALLPARFTDWRVLTPMRWAVGGTIHACRLARDSGLAINLSGGYHHASPDHGHGFCVYADAAIALARLHAERSFRSALIVDTDVHQGDGAADCVRSWPWANMFDLYEQDLFPWPKAAEAFPVPLRSGMGGAEYLSILYDSLPKALDRFNPDFVLYNAGSDVLITDPLASLTLKPEDMIDRDLFVVTEVRERGIPLAMVLSGGYGPYSWEAHARSIEALATRFDSVTPSHPRPAPAAATSGR